MKKRRQKKILKKKIKWLLLLIVFIVFGGYFFTDKDRMKASTIVNNGDFRLTAENKWSHEDKKITRL